MPSWTLVRDRSTADEASSSSAADWHESPEGQNWAEALEDLDIAIAERRCTDAVQLLSKADGDCSHPQAIDWSDPDHQSRCFSFTHKHQYDICGYWLFDG